MTGPGKTAFLMVVSGMTDIISPEQQEWLSAHVAQGEFASIEDAVRQLIDESIAGRAEIERDDLAWAKPFVDDAFAEAERGDVLTRKEYRTCLLADPGRRGDVGTLLAPPGH